MIREGKLPAVPRLELVTNWAQRERDLLCDLLLAAGPAAPTLCGDWTTLDLAAHLILRERRPDAAPGIVVPWASLRRYTERVQRSIAQSERSWPELVATVRGGPPLWSPLRFGPLDEVANTVEFFIHHEDVRRAVPDWEPRTVDAGLEHALGKALGRLRALIRRAPGGLELHTPDGAVVLAKPGQPMVVAIAPASELLLFAYGRQNHARVELSGSEPATLAVLGARFGL